MDKNAEKKDNIGNNVTHLKSLDGFFDLEDRKKISIVNIPKGLQKEKRSTLIHNISQETVFINWSDESQENIDEDKRELRKNDYFLWKEIPQGEKGLYYKKNKFANIDSAYFIQGISTDNSSHKNNFHKVGLSRESLQESFTKLKNFVKEKVSNNKGFSILRGGDGDYFFLRQIALGSAKPGRRALTTTYDKIDIELFRNLFWQNDEIALNLEKREHRDWMKFIIVDFFEKIFSKIFHRPVKALKNGKVAYAIDRILTPITFGGLIPLLIAYIYSFKKGKAYYKKAKDIITNKVIPSEAVYALVATRWIFKNFKNQIGIIASENKGTLIKELMRSKEYQEYLGTDIFTDYILVPEKGAANDVINLSKKLEEQVKKSSAKIFLVGAGSSKLALIPLLKLHSNAVFIDVGCGVDAIAGIVCQERPYFAEWTDYRIKNYDYSKIDFMDKGNPAWNNEEYKTTYIDVQN